MGCAILLGGSDAALADGNPSQAIAKGAYCPLPEPGQTPRCLAPAQAEYADFFRALDRGALDSEATARVEADLLSGDRAHLALSSLTYGYYRLALSAASEPDANPDFVARLEHWNTLLAETYESSVPLRGALREAAADLGRKAPAVPLACADGTHSCTATSDLTQALAAIDSAAGVQRPLVRLWKRWQSAFEGDTEPAGDRH